MSVLIVLIGEAVCCLIFKLIILLFINYHEPSKTTLMKVVMELISERQLHSNVKCISYSKL